MAEINSIRTREKLKPEYWYEEEPKPKSGRRRVVRNGAGKSHKKSKKYNLKMQIK